MVYAGSSGLHLRPAGKHERGNRPTTAMGFEARSQGFKHLVALLTAGRHHRKHPLHESVPTFQAVLPPAGPPPARGISRRSLRRLVRRLDPTHPCRVHCPECHAIRSGYRAPYSSLLTIWHDAHPHHRRRHIARRVGDLATAVSLPPVVPRGSGRSDRTGRAGLAKGVKPVLREEETLASG
jgi:hypothetical protein